MKQFGKEKWQYLKRIGKEALSILYPRRCPFCTDILTEYSKQVCDICKDKIPYIHEPRCMKCGKQVVTEEVEYCMDCSSKMHEYNQGIALWTYDKLVKQSIYRFKYKNKREYVSFYAQELVNKYGEMIRSWNAEALIPIPLHKSKKRKRGYNQAEILAREIGIRLEIPIYPKLLIRSKKTVPQKMLNNLERQKNLKNAFKIIENGVKLKRVILVDDIYTTGSTVDAVTRQLRHENVEEIYVIVLCIGKGY